MFACRDIFAKPQVTQGGWWLCHRTPRGASLTRSINTSVYATCVYYTMKQKCLLARVFLRSRQ